MSAYRLNEEKMFADITDGVAVVINSETGIYYGMTPLATCIFDALCGGESPNDLETQLQRIPGCPADIRRMLDDFIGNLLTDEIIVPGGVAAKVTLNADCAKEGWSISVQDYSDAKELLLADPVAIVGE